MVRAGNGHLGGSAFPSTAHLLGQEEKESWHEGLIIKAFLSGYYYLNTTGAYISRVPAGVVVPLLFDRSH